MVFLNEEMIRFDIAVTAITEIDITTAGSNLTVMANAEHMPRIWTVMGFSLLSGPSNSFLVLAEKKGSLSAFAVLIWFLFF
jgi:hypothetical protein